MSWTSEHDPPSDDPQAAGATLGPFDDPPFLDEVTDDQATDDEVTDDGVDLDESGPLDPSIFDGLFADLGPRAPSDDHGDNPLEAFLTTSLTSDADDAPAAPERFVDDHRPSIQEEPPSIDDLFDDVPTAPQVPIASFPSAVGHDRAGEATADGDGDADWDDDEWEDADDVELAPEADEDRTARVHFDFSNPEPATAPFPVEQSDESSFADRQPASLFPIEPMPPEDLLRPLPAVETNELGTNGVGHHGLDEHEVVHLLGAPDQLIEDQGPAGQDHADQAYDDEVYEDEDYDDEDYEDQAYDDEAYEDQVYDDDAYDDEDYADLDGPPMASPPIQHDPEPTSDLAAVEESFEQPVAREVTTGSRPRRPLALVAMAIAIGGALGIGGAVLLASITGGSEGNDENAAAQDAAVASEDAAGTSTEPDPAGAVASPVVDELELASLRFVPGSDPARLEDAPAAELLVEAIARTPSTPITATVRSYRAPTAAEDLELSIRQAEDLEAQLIELGALPDQVAVVGVGRSLLSTAQPVPNFVVPTAGLGASTVGDVARRVGPFAIGVDRSTGELRAESREALTNLAQAMVDDPEQRPLTLAAYSFTEPGGAANDRLAQVAATAATDYLTASGVDPSRLTVILAGDEPYAVTDVVGTHIDLRVGQQATIDLALDRLGLEALDFAAGSAELDPAGQAIIDGLAALLESSSVVAVIDVHSFDGDDLQASVLLSVSRAQAIGQRLVDAGIAGDRLRLHGGASPQFRSDIRSARMTVTLVPGG